MTHEQHARFESARRSGMNADAALAHCGYHELPLETAESRNRGDVITAEPDEPDDTGMVAALLARKTGPRAPKPRSDIEP